MRDIFYIVVLVFGIIVLYGSSKTYDKLKPQVGKQLVLDNDTLTITNFNTWNSEYGLSNGQTIYYQYGNELIIK